MQPPLLTWGCLGQILGVCLVADGVPLGSREAGEQLQVPRLHCGVCHPSPCHWPCVLHVHPCPAPTRGGRAWVLAPAPCVGGQRGARGAGGGGGAGAPLSCIMPPLSSHCRRADEQGSGLRPRVAGGCDVPATAGGSPPGLVSQPRVWDTRRYHYTDYCFFPDILIGLLSLSLVNRRTAAGRWPQGPEIGLTQGLSSVQELGVFFN